MAESPSSVFRKVEVTSDELGCLAEEISMESVKDVTWFLLSACSKMRREKSNKQKELLKNGRFEKFSAYAYCRKRESTFRREYQECG